MVRESGEAWEQFWKEYYKKYGRLIYKIAHQITGDRPICSVEDNHSDLVIAAINSVDGFMKKTGLPLNELMDNPLFDGYTKTSLWFCKNSKGSRVEERRHIRDGMLSLDYEYPLSGGKDTRAGLFAEMIGEESQELENVEYQDFFKVLGEDEELVVATIIKNPRVFTEKGRLKLATLSKVMDKKFRSYELEKILGSIRNKLRKAGFNYRLVETENN